MNRPAVVAACALMAGCAGAAAPGPDRAYEGYLTSAVIMDLATSAAPLEPHRVDETANDFTAIQPGTDRWWLAIAHAELRPPEAAQHFDCALGVRLTEKPRPALNRLMGRLLADSEALTRQLSSRTHRPRPIAVLPGLEACQRAGPAQRDSPSWPAGAAVAGAAWGELFAALAPDRADHVRATARELGLSRVICRMNWPADVADGQRLGAALYDEASTTSAFDGDLAKARREVAEARIEGLTNPGCAAERRAFRQAGRGLTSVP